MTQQYCVGNINIIFVDHVAFLEHVVISCISLSDFVCSVSLYIFCTVP